MSHLQLRRRRIAIIDDDPTFVDLMHELLALGEGYDVVSTTNWLESIDFIRDARPDLLILDMMLGREQTGPAVLQMLHEDPSTRDMPVLVCSAAAPSLLRKARELRASGAVATLAKPFDVDQLLRIIEHLLDNTAVLEGHA